MTVPRSVVVTLLGAVSLSATLAVLVAIAAAEGSQQTGTQTGTPAEIDRVLKSCPAEIQAADAIIRQNHQGESGLAYATNLARDATSTFGRTQLDGAIKIKENGFKLLASAPPDPTNDWIKSVWTLELCIYRAAKGVGNAAPPPIPGPAPPPKVPDSCVDAGLYLDSPDGLLGEYDKAVARLDLRREYQQELTTLKKQLLDDTWWTRSIGADVAREVKFAADMILQVYKAFTPVGRIVAEAEDLTTPGFYDLDRLYGTDESTILSKMVPSATELLTAVGATGDAGKVIKSAYDNGESLKSAALAVGRTIAELGADQLVKRALAQVGAKSLFPVYKILKAVYSRAKTANEAREFKSVVQEQLQRIDAALNEVQTQIAASRQNLQAINEIHSTVIGLCPGLSAGGGAPAGSPEIQSAEEVSRDALRRAADRQRQVDAEAKNGLPKKNRPDLEASHCLSVLGPAEGLFGGFQNKCGFKVNLFYCTTGSPPGSSSAAFECGKSGGSSSADANGRVTLHTKDAQIVYWAACKDPGYPMESEMLPGVGIHYRCR